MKHAQCFVEKLAKATFVDDIITGADNEEEAYHLYSQSKEILKQGGSTCESLLQLNAPADSSREGQK